MTLPLDQAPRTAVPRRWLARRFTLPWRRWIMPLLLGPLTAWAQAPNPCGALENHYGPYDYRTERLGALRIVEKSHFGPGVESLVRGIGSDYLQQDLNYVLKTSPNHHRALIATIRLAERMHTPHVPRMEYSVECFLDRGLRFRPDDTVVRVLFAQYVGKQLKDPQRGVALLDAGQRYSKDNPLSVYNFGLAYLELGAHDKALQHAHRAAALGVTRTELPEALVRAGHWRDPSPVTEPPVEASGVRP